MDQSLPSSVGCGKRWPNGNGSDGRPGRTARHVSLVPRLMAISPTASSPKPTAAHGLSPDHATTSALLSPRAFQKLLHWPTFVHEGTGCGNTRLTPPPTNSRSLGAHCLVERSIRFIPAASD